MYKRQAKGRALFTRFPVRGIKPEGNSWEDDEETGTLLAYDFDQQRCAVIQDEVEDIRLGADHRTLVYTLHDKMRVIDALGELPDENNGDSRPSHETPGRRSGYLDLHRASVLVEPLEEWTQM